MGMTIAIGEAALRVVAEDDDAPITAWVETRTHPDAPAEGGDRKHGNTRSFTYGGFEAWARAAGLHELFRDPARGIVPEFRTDVSRRECVLLRPEHLAAIRAAQQRPHPEPAEGWTHHAPLLAWFEWWMAWALAHCKVPAIYSW